MIIIIIVIHLKLDYIPIIFFILAMVPLVI
jgi:hypothetical protein